jgi:hypothetical protein
VKLPLYKIELFPKLCEFGLNFAALPFILQSAQEPKHRFMAAPGQPERSFGESSFSGFKFALCQPGMGKASPEIRSDNRIADRSLLLIHSRHSTLSLREKATTLGCAADLKHFLVKVLFIRS